MRRIRLKSKPIRLAFTLILSGLILVPVSLAVSLLFQKSGEILLKEGESFKVEEFARIKLLGYTMKNSPSRMLETCSPILQIKLPDMKVVEQSLRKNESIKLGSYRIRLKSVMNQRALIPFDYGLFNRLLLTREGAAHQWAGRDAEIYLTAKIEVTQDSSRLLLLIASILPLCGILILIVQRFLHRSHRAQHQGTSTRH